MNDGSLSHMYTLRDVFVWNQESKASINGRNSHTSIVYKDRLYIFGGMENSCPNQFYCSDDLLIYDICNSCPD